MLKHSIDQMFYLEGNHCIINRITKEIDWIQYNIHKEIYHASSLVIALRSL